MKRQSRLAPSLMISTSNGTYAEDVDMQTPSFCSAGSGPVLYGGKPPRQMVSDMKWEGATWISPEDLARNVSKRSRRHCDGDDGDDGNGVGDVTTSAGGKERVMHTSRPPRPQDPVDAVVEGGVTRRRDKDRIPTAKTWTWCDGSATWQLIDRPRLFQVGMFFAYASIPPKQEELLLLMLDDATTAIDDAFLRDGLVPRLNRTHPVSLRLLDWLVVDYAREKDIAYRRYVPTLKREMIVVMHALYTSWLHRWRRRHYDPFRRRHRIYFTLDGETYSTTVAQLHFFYMARLFGFLDYATDHLDEILPHMKATLAGTSEAKTGAKNRGEEYRRRPLVSKARPKAFMSTGTFELRFSLNGATDFTSTRDAGNGSSIKDGDGDGDGDDNGDDNGDDDGDGDGTHMSDATLVSEHVPLHIGRDTSREAAQAGLRDSMACLFAD